MQNRGLGTSLRRGLLFFLRLGIAAGIIGWIIARNKENIVASLRQIDPLWLLLAALLYAFHLLMGAVRWYLLLRVQRIDISLGETFSLLMQGFFFSLVIPGGALGGDLVKAGFLSRRTASGDKLKGIFTIFIDRVVGMIGLFLLAGILGMLAWRFLHRLEGYMVLVVWLLLLGCCGGLSGILMLFWHRRLEQIRPCRWLLDYGNRLSGGAVAVMIRALDDFRSSVKTILICIFISLIFIHLNLGAVILLIGLGVGVTNPDICLFLLSTALGNAAGVIPITPSGLGTRDAVIKQVLEAGGQGEEAAAIPLIFTALVLCFNLLGGVFFSFRRQSVKHPSNITMPTPSPNAS